jgi:two-component system chemotaxis response regulator CheY
MPLMVSQFTPSLPRGTMKPENNFSRTDTNYSRDRSTSMRILLVDDSSTMRRIQKNQIIGLGITDVLEAENGEDAWNKLLENMPIDLILLDWNMPVMDGYTFLKKVREENTYKAVKIIMCTSESEKSRVVEALKAGANNYIVKPFSPEALKEKLGI